MNQTDLLEIALFLMNELDRYGKLHGYKLLHLKCIQAGFVVSQSVIRHLLGVLDPGGVQMRRKNRICYVEQMQKFLRYVDHDEYAENCFIYGSSNHIQRIES